MASEPGSIIPSALKQPASSNSTTPKKEHIPHFDSEDHLRQTIAALLTRLPNHRNVQIAHGPLEKGKDIIFSVPTAFNRTQHCACVVKNTPITASHTAKANLSSTLSQVRKAFASPFLDSNAHEAFISKCFLICPHEISQMTLTIIKEELLEFRDNLVVIDGPELFTLLQQYYPDYKPDEFTFKTHRLSEFRRDVQEDHALSKLAFNQLHLGAARDAYKVYVQPTFEARLTHREVSSEAFLRDLVPTAPRSLEAQEPAPSKAITPLRPAVYPVTEAYINLVVRQKASFLERCAVFLKLGPLDQQRVDLGVRRFEELLSFLSVVYSDRSEHDRVIAQVKEACGGRLIVPSERFTVLSEARTALLLEHLTTVQQELTSLVSYINRAFSADFARLEAESKSAGILDRETFRNTLFRSDHFSINPSQYLVDKEVRRIRIEKEAFHGSCSSALIVGPAGYGKTSFCKWHTLEDDKLYSKGSHQWIAVYIPLNKLTATEVSSLSHTIKQHALLAEDLFGRSGSPQRPLGYRVYLDGLDEVNDELARIRILGLVRSRKELGQPTSYVLTSRDHLVGPDTLGIPRLYICALNDEQINELAQLWLGDKPVIVEFTRQLNETPSLRELARIPLLCTLIILIYKKTLSIPENKLRLYETFIELLSSGWDLAKGVQRGTSHKAEFKILLLRRVGLQAHLNRKKTFNKRDLNLVLSELEVRLPSDEMNLLMDELLSDGVVQKTGGNYEFRHLSFQEYLAACELFNDPNKQNANTCLSRFLRGDQWWRDVMQFYVLMVRDPLNAIRWVEHAVQEDEIRTGVKFANAEYLKSVARKAFTAEHSP